MKLVKKRVLFVLGTLEMGGAERQALYLARYLKNVHSANIRIWGMTVPGLLAEYCRQNDIPCEAIPFRWPCRKKTLAINFMYFLWRIWKEKPDIILPYTTGPNVLCNLVWRFSGAKMA